MDIGGHQGEVSDAPDPDSAASLVGEAAELTAAERHKVPLTRAHVGHLGAKRAQRFCRRGATVLVALGFFYLPACVLWQYVLFDPPLAHVAQLGHVTSDRAALWVRAVGCEHIVVEYKELGVSAGAACVKAADVWPGGDRDGVTGLFIGRIPSGDDSSTVVSLTGLKENTCHVFHAVATECSWGNAGEKSVVLKDRGSFVTFPRVDQDVGPLSFVFGSCISVLPWPFSSLDVFGHILQTVAPRFALILGDLVYTDIHHSLPVRLPFDQAYRQVWSDHFLDRFVSHTPTFLMFDDHEVWNNFAGERNERSREGLAWFQHYLGRRNPPSHSADGYFFEFSYGSLLDVFVLDTRSEMSGPPCTNAEDETLPRSRLGDRQREALRQWLASSTATFRVIASPVSFTSATDECEGWRAALSEREEIFDMVLSSRGRDDEMSGCGVILLSGDTHHGAAYRYRGHIHEFSASPFQALPFPPPSNSVLANTRSGGKNNEEVLHLSANGFHYGHIDIFPEGPGTEPSIKFSLYQYFLSIPELVYTATVSYGMTCPR